MCGSWCGDVPLGKTLNPKLSQKAQTSLWARDTYPAHKIIIKSFCLSLFIPPHLDERTWILTEHLEPSTSSVSLACGQSMTGNMFPASSVLQPELAVRARIRSQLRSLNDGTSVSGGQSRTDEQSEASASVLTGSESVPFPEALDLTVICRERNMKRPELQQGFCLNNNLQIPRFWIISALRTSSRADVSV